MFVLITNTENINIGKSGEKSDAWDKCAKDCSFFATCSTPRNLIATVLDWQCKWVLIGIDPSLIISFCFSPLVKQHTTTWT